MQPTTTKLIPRPPRPARRGTSLIEILVVLVILVVGILSIVRLFPAGFIALRNAENNTFADRLATGALEQLKKSGNGLPDAIYMYTDTLGFNPNVAPDDLRVYNPDANGVNQDNGTTPTQFDDINKQRYISNETMTVPATRMDSAKSFLPIYVLNYGPVSLPASTPPGNSLKINSLPWTPQTGDSRLNVSDQSTPQRSVDDPLDILQAGQQKFLVDYGAGAIAVPTASYDQYFYVQVTQKNGGIQPPVFITVPATVTSPASGYNGNWFSASNAGAVTGVSTLPATTDPWISVTVYRPFRYVTTSTSPTFSIDPYEYAVYSSNFAGANANPGVLAFNPLASGRNGTAPLKARISYLALDWHILHEDRDVSTGTPTIRLTLGHLKKIGDVQFDQNTYKGLISGMAPGADIMLVDLDTGDVIPLNTTNVQNDDDNTGAAVGDGIYQVSYQNGRVTFPANIVDKTKKVTVRPAQHVRFFYAGDADWSLAIQKAPSVYVHSVIHNANAPDTEDPTPISQTSAQKSAVVTPTPNLYALDATNLRVLFPRCDAGKLVEFDGISYTDSSGTSQQVGQGTGQISTDMTSPNSNLVYVNLTDTGLNKSGILSNVDKTKPITFQAVRGISAQAIVIWHERNRWRTRTIDTLLTQTP